MILRDWFRPPRHLLAPFIAIILVPACALAWLAWRMLEQDRVAAQQAARERLDNAAGLVAGRLLARLSEIEDKLPSLHADDNAMVVRLRRDGVEVRSGVPLLYHPFVPPAAEPNPALFEAAQKRRGTWRWR